MQNGKSPNDTDRALRAISEDGSFRLLIASTTDTAADILTRQGAHAGGRALLADLVSGTVLLRLTMSPDYRLQGILQRDGLGSMVVDSLPDGTTRGLLRLPLDVEFPLGPPTRFSVHRQLFGGKLHQGIVEASENQALSDVLTGYLHRSEQIHSVVGLAHRFDDDRLQSSGGFLIQQLPEADQATLALMTARLESLPPATELFATHGQDLESLTAELFGPIDYQILGEDHFHSGCVCSVHRVVAALQTVSEEELIDLAEGDDHLTVDCEYCGASHQIPLSTLRPN